MFTCFWCVLELFIGKFIQNINNEHAQDYSCPGATFASCSHREKLPRQGGFPGVVQRVTRLSKLPRGNEELMWTVTGVRPCTEAKFTPGLVSCPGAMSCPGIMWTGPIYPALKAVILVGNDSLTSEESKAKNRLWIPHTQNKLWVSEIVVIKIQITVKQFINECFPYSTKMLLTHSTYEVFTNGFLLWTPQKSGYHLWSKWGLLKQDK